MDPSFRESPELIVSRFYSSGRKVIWEEIYVSDDGGETDRNDRKNTSNDRSLGTIAAERDRIFTNSRLLRNTRIVESNPTSFFQTIAQQKSTPSLASYLVSQVGGFD